MKHSVKKTIVTLGACAALFPLGAVHAQTAEGDLNVGVQVQIAQDGAEVSGLDDISINYDGTTGFGAVFEDNQLFCVFSPTRYFNMTIRGTHKGADPAGYYVADSTKSNTPLEFLRYRFRVLDAFSGINAPIGSSPNGSFTNNISETGIDSDLFNTDKTCTDGENLELKFSIVLDGDPENGPVVAELVDGQLHNYTDTVTIIVEPNINL